MKQLVAPGVERVSSTLARSRVSGSAPGRAVCFVDIYRDCTNDDCYLQFSDGSLYHYIAPASAIAQSITVARWHGVTFNELFRRSLTVGGGYERLSGGLPSTAALIYSFPPYAGTDPGPCLACVAGFTMVASANITVTSTSLPPYNTQVNPVIFIPIISTFTCQFNSPSAFMWYWECTAAFTNNPTILLDGVNVPFTFNGTPMGHRSSLVYDQRLRARYDATYFARHWRRVRVGSPIWCAAVELSHLSQVKRIFGPRAGRSPAPGPLPARQARS